MTVRGYMVGDELAAYPDLGPAELKYYEQEFRKINAHTYCEVCRSTAWAHRAFVWPRNGFSEFPLDFRPGVVQTVQPV